MEFGPLFGDVCLEQQVSQPWSLEPLFWVPIWDPKTGPNPGPPNFASTVWLTLWWLTTYSQDDPSLTRKFLHKESQNLLAPWIIPASKPAPPQSRCSSTAPLPRLLCQGLTWSKSRTSLSYVVPLQHQLSHWDLCSAQQPIVAPQGPDIPPHTVSSSCAYPYGSLSLKFVCHVCHSMGSQLGSSFQAQALDVSWLPSRNWRLKWRP